jgi:hypothetical protein
MKKAAALAEQAAQLLQRALTQADQEYSPQPSEPVQMSIATPKRKPRQHIRPETTKLIENTALRRFEPPTMSTGVAGHTPSSPPEPVWEDGDNWWKPLQSISSSDAHETPPKRL